MIGKKLFYTYMIFLCIFLMTLPIVFSDLVEIVIEYEETPPIFSYEVVGVPVNFGSLYPDTYDNPASSTVMVNNTGTASFDISIKADDFVSGPYSIGVGSCTYNTVNNPLTSTSMSTSYVTVGTDIAPGNNLILWFWVDVPLYQEALNYESILYINIQ